MPIASSCDRQGPKKSFKILITVKISINENIVFCLFSLFSVSLVHQEIATLSIDLQSDEASMKG